MEKANQVSLIIGLVIGIPIIWGLLFVYILENVRKREKELEFLLRRFQELTKRQDRQLDEFVEKVNDVS